MGDGKLLRIGVFYDGQYFYNVSNYYNFEHSRKARISIKGFHEFIRDQVAKECHEDFRLCQIVDAHYFRGRLSAKDAENKNKLFAERVFDTILTDANVTTHYLPLKPALNGAKQEKGIDVWLALEAYELAMFKRYDVLVLIACDGDYAPLVRKLNTLGIKVMLASWDFEFIDEKGIKRTTRTSQQLLDEVSFPVAMHQLIEDRVKSRESIINNLFIAKTTPLYFPKEITQQSDETPAPASKETFRSKIMKVYEGYGFIYAPEVNNVFFHYTSLENIEFSELTIGREVEYVRELNSEGKYNATKVFAL